MNDRRTQGALHSKLKAAFQRALSKEPDVVLLNNAQGFDADRKIKYGLGVGSPDLIGIGPRGRFIGFEFKTGKATQEPNQLLWQKLIRMYGGVCEVIRANSVEEIPSAIAEGMAFIKEMRHG